MTLLVYVSVYMFIIFSRVHIYIHVYTHTYMCTHMYICIYMQIMGSQEIQALRQPNCFLYLYYQCIFLQQFMKIFLSLFLHQHLILSHL